MPREQDYEGNAGDACNDSCGHCGRCTGGRPGPRPMPPPEEPVDGGGVLTPEALAAAFESWRYYPDRRRR